MKCITCQEDIIGNVYGEGQCHNCWWAIAVHNGKMMEKENEI